jgi:hypothetical protein
MSNLRVTCSVGKDFVYRQAMGVSAAAGGTRARMGLHVPAADVT